MSHFSPTTSCLFKQILIQNAWSQRPDNENNPINLHPWAFWMWQVRKTQDHQSWLTRISILQLNALQQKANSAPSFSQVIHLAQNWKLMCFKPDACSNSSCSLAFTPGTLQINHKKCSPFNSSLQNNLAWLIVFKCFPCCTACFLQ